MAISSKIEYLPIEELYLDPQNPRLGRETTQKELSQEEILEEIKTWTLDELAISFIESGFWPQEAVLIIEEKLNGKPVMIVVEGNRRLAALKYLKRACDGNPVSSKWAEIIKSKNISPKLFEEIPCLKISSRKEIASFLGFRHVTGIKEWHPAEKAEYIAMLIDEHGMTYEEVMRKIGSKTNTVRQLYIAYRLLRQMENVEGISLEHVEKEFSVLFLSLRSEGAQSYLQIDINAKPSKAKKPVPPKNTKSLVNYALWMFGNDSTPPLFTDSRQVDKFGRILLSKDAVKYLERNDRPNFDVAYRIAGGDEPEIVDLINKASDNIELALTKVHLHRKSPDVQKAIKRLGSDAWQILKTFPNILEEIKGEK